MSANRNPIPAVQPDANLALKDGGDLSQSYKNAIEIHGIAAITISARATGNSSGANEHDVTQIDVVLDRGQVVHEGASATLLADREQLDRWPALPPASPQRFERFAQYPNSSSWHSISTSVTRASSRSCTSATAWL